MSVVLIMVMVSQVYTFVHTHQTVYIRCLQFIVYQLYFNEASFYEEKEFILKK